MCLVTDTARKLGVNVRDVFALAAEDSREPQDANNAFVIWFHEQFPLAFVRQYCLKVLAQKASEFEEDMA